MRRQKDVCVALQTSPVRTSTSGGKMQRESMQARRNACWTKLAPSLLLWARVPGLTETLSFSSPRMPAPLPASRASSRKGSQPLLYAKGCLWLLLFPSVTLPSMLLQFAVWRRLHTVRCFHFKSMLYCLNSMFPKSISSFKMDSQNRKR